VWTEPHYDLHSLAINRSHKTHLRPTLAYVRLVDADGVDEDPAFHVFSSHKLEICVDIRSDVELLLVEGDFAVGFSSTAVIR
jgi:hypothetical protein